MSFDSRLRRGTSLDDSEAITVSKYNYGTDDDAFKGNFTDEGVYFSRQNDKLSRTGRQRKKQTARTKGGEFQSKREKRRVYFCCVGSEINMMALFAYMCNLPTDTKMDWNARQYGDAICLTRLANGISCPDNCKITEPGYQEVYIFEFGVIVFWGVGHGEEKFVLTAAKKFVTHGAVNDLEFESGEDDMAFAISPDSAATAVSVANDVILLPEGTNATQRLSVSFAIAQSSVVSIFEQRIESKVDEYKFIPETLAEVGKINLPIKKVGMMIGDIFVVRHDLNLHSDILDTPDYFWEEDRYEVDYARVVKYLEMETRVEVLNTRLDMMKELLDMIQQQMQNEHARKLEWIVIWLILVEVVIEVVSGGGALLGWWSF